MPIRIGIDIQDDSRSSELTGNPVGRGSVQLLGTLQGVGTRQELSLTLNASGGSQGARGEVAAGGQTIHRKAFRPQRNSVTKLLGLSSLQFFTASFVEILGIPEGGNPLLRGSLGEVSVRTTLSNLRGTVASQPLSTRGSGRSRRRGSATRVGGRRLRSLLQEEVVVVTQVVGRGLGPAAHSASSCEAAAGGHGRGLALEVGEDRGEVAGNSLHHRGRDRQRTRRQPIGRRRRATTAGGQDGAPRARSVLQECVMQPLQVHPPAAAARGSRSTERLGQRHDEQARS